MRNFLRTGVVVVALVMVSLLAMPRASAQLDPDTSSFGVYQFGVLVGEIYRQDTDASHYTEHWVLYPRYVYPSEANGISITIKPGQAGYQDLADFLARVPFERGSRYVTTSCSDGTTLPGR